MFAQEEERDKETGKQLVAPGFQLIQMAYKDDIRPVPKEISENGLLACQIPASATSGASHGHLPLNGKS